MEAALRENRMTLEAIKTTQTDRDLFKHLITESTNYVASDYMRHANDRRKKVEQTLTHRVELMNAQSSLVGLSSVLNNMQGELGLLTDSESGLEQDYQAASDHLQLVQTAVRQQEKIERYSEDLEELTERLEEQVMVVEEAAEQLAMSEEQAQLTEEEVDSLKTQLADYQQALDMQQTRALQYQQAVKALEKAQQLTANDELTQNNAIDLQSELKAKEERQTTALLAIKHKLDLSSAAVQQFERGLALVTSIAGHVERSEASDKAKALIEQARQFSNIAERAEQLKAQYKDLERAVRLQRQAQELAAEYAKRFNITVDSEIILEEEQARHEEMLETVQEQQENIIDKRSELKRQEQQLRSETQRLESIAPKWIAGNDALHKLNDQCGVELEDSHMVISQMQETLENERVLSTNKDRLATRKEELDGEIERLAAPGGSGDARLKGLADTLGGVLLSEIYDDITLSDAPYFSSLYGPARHAIVVSDLSGIKEKLVDLDDCPDDLYIIEGDIDAFDDSVFDADEMENAVCVHLNDRQMRYSRFPELPLFGRAAREQRLDTLREEREIAVEEHAKAAFDSQKLQRLYQSFNGFVSTHLAVAFDADPEVELKKHVSNYHKQVVN